MVVNCLKVWKYDLFLCRFNFESFDFKNLEERTYHISERSKEPSWVGILKGPDFFFFFNPIDAV